MPDSIHDVKLYKMKHPQFLDVQTNDTTTHQVTIYADRGYQGAIDVSGIRMLTPFKKKKGQKLTAEQKKYKLHSKIRIYVEHAIRKVKRWRIMRDAYRNPLKMYDTINDIVCGLVNNRILWKTA